MDIPFESNDSLKIDLSEAETPPSVASSAANRSSVEPETIFIWIDILGFSALVENESKYNELLGLLKDFFESFNKLNASAECHRISDGIILKLKPNIRNADVVRQFFEDVMSVQKTFLLRQRFLRGGIAVGSKFNITNIDNGFYISNGLARAYNLESNSITWPIIGTNERFLNDICSIYGENVKEIFDIAYSENKDKIYYLNFYKTLSGNELSEVYKNILVNISNTEKNPHVQHKYIWIQKMLEKINENLITLRCPNCGGTTHA
jgi:hypothetical protein